MTKLYYCSWQYKYFLYGYNEHSKASINCKSCGQDMLTIHVAF